MRRLPLLLLVLTASLACGRKKQDGARAVAEDEGRDKARTCTLPATGLIAKDVTISRGCLTVVERSVVVTNGAKLVIEPGVTLAFERGTGLRIEKGALDARGTPDAKVVFTSHAQTKAAGDWIGISFADDGSSTPSVIAHATIEHAGGKAKVVAALNLEETAGKVALENVSFAHLASAAIVASRASALVRCEACSTSDVGDTSLVVPAEMLPVFIASSFDAPVHVFGDVTRSLVWPKLVVPIHIDRPMSIDSGDKKAPAVLDVGEGNTLVLHPRIDLIVGGTAKGGSGALLARRVRFTGLDTRNWGSIVLNNAPSGTVIDGCTLEHGGDRLMPYAMAEPRGVIVLPTTDRGVAITNNHFVDDAAPAMGGEEDCHGHDRPANGNTSKPQDLCWESPLKALLMMDLAGIGAGASTKGSLIDLMNDSESSNMIAGPGDGPSAKP